MSNEAKLAELRARTDRDLLVLIERELDRGIALASVASTKGSPLHTQAERAYRRTVRLALQAPVMSRRVRVRIDAKLKEFRFLLDDAPAVRKVAQAWGC